MTTIQIVPKVIEKLGNIEHTATQADITVTNIELFNKAAINVSLKDESGNVWFNHYYEITDEEYNAWNDDAYIINHVKTTLGIEEVIPVPES